MVTTEATDTQGVLNATLYGLSGDDKPNKTFDDIPLPNGAKFVEMDTKKVYFWDAENEQWV